jgi:hypothetical protein
LNYAAAGAAYWPLASTVRAQAPPTDPLAWQTDILYKVFKDGSLEHRLPVEFRARVRSAPSTHAVFFPNAAAPMFASTHRAYIDNVSKLTVAAALNKTSTMSFGDMVRDPSPQLMAAMDVKTNADASAEREEITKNLVINSDFNQFMMSVSTWQTRAYWAYKLFSFLTTDQFINKENGLLSAQEPNWVEKMALDAYKIELLDASRLDPLLARWAVGFPGTKIGEMVRSRDFFPALPDWKGEVDATQEDVRTAIAQTRKEHSSSNNSQGGSAGRSFNHSSTTTYYGESVIDFVKNQLGPMNLWTGATPNNTTEDKS